MRVLQVCLKPPVPSVDGGCKAMNSVTQGLLDQGIDVKVLTIATQKHPFQKDKISEDYLNKTKIESVFVDTKVKPLDAFCNLFTNESYNIKRFYSKDFEDLIIETLSTNHFDVVILESLYVLPYLQTIRNHSNSKVIYRSHNIEFEIWERSAKQAKGAKKNYLNILAKRIKQFEVEQAQKVDAIAAITQKDKDQLIQLGITSEIQVIPFGINISDYVIQESKTNSSVFHIGSMDWLPNEEAIKWFLNTVWDKIVVNNPQTKLRLAGKNMPEWMLNHNQSNVEILGEVKSANDFINSNTIMIVPLKSGSGMRIKIIEAMALGKLVISTSVGAEGINYANKENIVIANSEDDFIREINYYLANPKEAESIGSNARRLVENNFDKRVIVKNLVELFK
jgi:glycosyltransferase involved in cell wall biosynthesis